MQSVANIWLDELKQAVGPLKGLAALEKAVDTHYQVCCRAPEHFSAFYILWFESVDPNSELIKLTNSIHQRRCKDIMQWIREENSSHLSDSDIEQIAQQFCVALVGIVHQWLLSPQDLKLIEDLYTGLKTTMAMRLSAENSYVRS